MLLIEFHNYHTFTISKRTSVTKKQNNGSENQEDFGAKKRQNGEEI